MDLPLRCTARAVPPRPDKVLRLYFHRTHLPVLRILLDLRDQLLFLLLELRSLAV